MLITIFGPDVTGTMWVPANKDALPSTEEMWYAKKAISELKIMLKNAFELLEQTKVRVSTWTKDLDERKAWIAPIRKLPVEILSEIFIFTSEVDDLSPVTITEVCRFWRKVILSTPRAWSLIYADKLVNKSAYANSWGRIHGLPIQYLSTFIQRSNPCMLHISIPPDQNYFDKELDEFVHHPAQKVIASAIHRVQCLSADCWQTVDLGSDVFPNLAKLTISTDESDISPDFFNRSRFPCLRYLDCTRCPMYYPPVGGILFPPIQHLAVNIEYPGWIEVVQGCADTLVALNILERDGADPIQGAAVRFPRLNSLTFRTRSNTITTDVIWPIQATTPSLQSYEQMHLDRLQQSVVHQDVKNVTQVRTNQMIDLEEFVTLRILQFELRGHNSPLHVVLTVLHHLKENKDICPVLQAIRFSLSEEDYGYSFKLLIPGFENTVRSARPDVTLSFTDKSHIPLPGSFEEAECGRDMPCVWKIDQL